MEENFDEAFDYWWTGRTLGFGLAGAETLAGSRDLQFANHVFPLAVIGAGGCELPNWVQGYRAFWENATASATSDIDRDQANRHAKNAAAFGDHLRSITEQFQVSYVELDRDLEIDRVCDIFTKINSSGIRLDVFDLMNALLKPKGVQLKALWREAAPTLGFIDSPKTNVYILQIMSILRQIYCSPKLLYYLNPGTSRLVQKPDGGRERQVMIADAHEFSARWQDAVRALQRAIERLRNPHEFGVSKAAYLPYVSILPIFAAALAEVEGQPAMNRLAAEGRFRKWYWASIFTNRYSGSTETTAARDIQDLRAWFADVDAEPAVIGQLNAAITTLDLRGEVKKGNAIYNAIFNLLVIGGARDWVSGAVPRADELHDHHIVPKSWGSQHLDGASIDTILNRTPLTDVTNRDVIGDRLPNAYLPELIATNGRDAVEHLMASHFINSIALDVLLRAPFGPQDFEDFIRERQHMILDAVRSLLIGGRADLSPTLRALDGDVERIELAIRACIAVTLDDDPDRLPPHVRVKIDDRIAKEMKKQPGLDPARFTKLTAALEQADLRELQDVITSSVTSSGFAGRFPSKEVLNAKFGQLAELRNAIRHNRTASEVVKKEGEAAVIWFETALGASPS